MDWAQAIAFLQTYVEKNQDNWYVQLVWRELQLGDRTQDILMDIRAIKAIQDDGANASPEWQGAIKWLTYQRAQQSNLMIDMLFKQLESGDRTSELLQLIRQAAGQTPAPLPPTNPVVLPTPEPEQPEQPPSTTF